jgi:hypothetical protein
MVVSSNFTLTGWKALAINNWQLAPLIHIQLDSAVSRIFPLHERLALILRLEAFNALNHPAFAAPGSTGNLGFSSSLLSSTFGQVTSTLTSYGARVFQGAVKITF